MESVADVVGVEGKDGVGGGGGGDVDDGGARLKEAPWSNPYP